MVVDGGAKVKCKPSPSVWFLIPDGLCAQEFLPEPMRDRPGIRGRREEMLWLVSLVAQKMRARKVDQRGYARLNRRVLSRTIPERVLSAIEMGLVEGGVLQRAPYRAGHYATGYRFTWPWRARPLRRIKATDQQLIERVLRELARLEATKLARRLPVHDDLDRVHAMLSIDPASAEVVAGLEDAAKRQRQWTFLRQIRDGRPGCRSFTGRWYSPFCGVIRGLRPFFRLDGEPLGGYDLRCAQPALAAILFGQHFTQFIQCVGAYSSSSSDDMIRCVRGGLADAGGSVLSLEYISSVARGVPECGPDLERFRELTSSAAFYGYMLESSRRAGVDLSDGAGKGRSDLQMVKVLVLQECLAKRGTYPSAFEDVFRREFPSVHRAVRWVSSNASPADGFGRDRAHGKLIRILQRLEAALVIETVCPRLVAEIPVVPLHDCLFTRESDMERVVRAFEDVFDECGSRFGLKPDVPYEAMQLAEA